MKYELASLPGNAAEFMEMHGSMKTTPQGAAAAFIAALHLLSREKEEGENALKIIDPAMPVSRLRLAAQQIQRMPYLANSYLPGSQPENGYTPSGDMTLEFSVNAYSGSEADGRLKLFIPCSGAASPRPITVMRRPDGSWYAHEWSSIVTGIVPPK
jgi:hypothetical protein